MRTKRIGALLIALATGVASGAAVEEKNTTQRSFTLPAGPGRKIVIDNVHGGIKVTTHDANTVDITVQERWTGDSASQLADGRRETRLDMTQDGPALRVFVDGPFRQRNNWGHHHHPHYNAEFEFEVRAPRDAALTLLTVNGGKITVENSTGNFDVHHVNGPIELTDMTGSGYVHTVNGPVSVTFRSNPKEPCSFKTVNGAVTVTFQPGLSADLRVKSMRADVFTDFEVTTLPSLPPVTERRDGRFVYKADRTNGFRVGPGGGPEHRFETLNGSIRILNKGR
jgi:hypothetical protein